MQCQVGRAKRSLGICQGGAAGLQCKFLKSLVEKFESAQLFKEGRRREMRLNMELQAVAGSRNDLFVFSCIFHVFSVFDKIDSMPK